MNDIRFDNKNSSRRGTYSVIEEYIWGKNKKYNV